MRIVSLAVSMLLLSACQVTPIDATASAGDTTVSATGLASHRWGLVKVNEDTVKKGAWLQFDASQAQVHGSSGCNRYFGHADFEDGTLKLGVLAGTRRLCPDMGLERQFLGVFQKDFKAEMVGEQLRLTGTLSGQVMYFNAEPIPKE